MLFVFEVWIVLLSPSVAISKAEMAMKPSPLLVFESTAANQTTQSSSTHLNSSRAPREIGRSTTTPNPVDDQCPCSQKDFYGSLWIIPANETIVKSCKEGAVGNMTWTCDCGQGKCHFHQSQPDFSQCYSLELLSLFDEVTIHSFNLFCRWDFCFIILINSWKLPKQRFWIY